MHRRWLIAGLSTALLAGWSTNAHAEDANGFGRKGQLIISADRLFPVFSYTHATVTEDNGDGSKTKVTESGSSIALLWGNEVGVDDSVKVHTIPRVSVDYTIIDRLTLGGSLAVAFGLGGPSQKVETTSANGVVTRTDSVDKPNTSVVGFSPRVGYILPLSNLFAFWPRAGFSFYSVHTSLSTSNNNNNRDTTTNSIFSLDLDPQFALVPFEHFFFTFGPTVNFPVGGKASTENVNGATTVTHDDDLTVWHFGINAGLGGWFNL
jgi:hypothetical protein